MERGPTRPQVRLQVVLPPEALATATNTILPPALDDRVLMHPPPMLHHVLVLGKGAVTQVAGEGPLPLVDLVLVLVEPPFAPGGGDAALEATH